MTRQVPRFRGVSEFLSGTGRTLLWIAWAVGGYAASLLDNACGYAAQSKVAPGQTARHLS